MYKKCFNKKVLVVSVISLFFLQMLYVVVEPTVALAAPGFVASPTSPDDSMFVTLDVDPGVAISVAEDVTMLPNLSITNNKATGGSTWSVVTNNETGYALNVVASGTPALASSNDSFDEYSSGGTWTVPTAAKEFGFSAYGADATSLQTTGDCIGAGDPAATSLVYQGFDSSTPMLIASSTAVTSVDGTPTNICFGAEQNGVFAKSGTYTATITATVTVQ